MMPFRIFTQEMQKKERKRPIRIIISKVYRIFVENEYFGNTQKFHHHKY